MHPGAAVETEHMPMQPIAERIAYIDAELEPLRAEIIAAGIRRPKDDGICFLFREDYPTGLPIILDHLRKPYSDLTKARMVEALLFTKNSYCQAVWPEVASIYTATPNESKPYNDGSLPECDSYQKLILANVLIKQYLPKRFDAVLELVRDRRNGETRLILLTPLFRVRNRRPEAMKILQELKEDPQLATEIGARGVS